MWLLGRSWRGGCGFGGARIRDFCSLGFFLDLELTSHTPPLDVSGWPRGLGRVQARIVSRGRPQPWQRTAGILARGNAALLIPLPAGPRATRSPVQHLRPGQAPESCLYTCSKSRLNLPFEPQMLCSVGLGVGGRGAD